MSDDEEATTTQTDQAPTQELWREDHGAAAIWPADGEIRSAEEDVITLWNSAASIPTLHLGVQGLAIHSGESRRGLPLQDGLADVAYAPRHALPRLCCPRWDEAEGSHVPLPDDCNDSGDPPQAAAAKSGVELDLLRRDGVDAVLKSLRLSPCFKGLRRATATKW